MNSLIENKVQHPEVDDWDTEITLHSPEDNYFDFDFYTIQYTNLNYLISWREPNNELEKFKKDYIKEHNLIEGTKEYNKFEKLIKDIYYDSSKEVLEKHKHLFKENKFPLHLNYYKTEYGKTGYFAVEPRLVQSYTALSSTYILSDFLNANFNDYDTFFLFFTKYFFSFIDLFDKEFVKRLKTACLYDFNVITTLADNHYNDILERIQKYQKLLKELVDYSYNYTKDTDIPEISNKLYQACIRFGIYKQSHLKDFSYLIENAGMQNIFDLTFYSKNLNKISNKKILLEKLNSSDYSVWSTPIIHANNIFSFLYIIAYSCIIKNYYSIRKCKNCNKYFITDINSSQLYCENPFNEKQTCKDIGNQIAQYKKQQEDFVYGKYRKIYAKKAMLVKRNPDIKSYKMEYEQWKKEAQKYRNDIAHENKTPEEFEKWLDNNN